MFLDWLIGNPQWIYILGWISLPTFVFSIVSILVLRYKPAVYLKTKKAKKNREIAFVISLVLFALSFAGILMSADAYYKITMGTETKKIEQPSKNSEPNLVKK